MINKHFKALFCLVLTLVFYNNADGRRIAIGRDSRLKSISEAALLVKPGDTIVVSNGIYSGGDIIKGLKGNFNAWIVITAENPGTSIFSGGMFALHFSDPEYIVIENLRFADQTGNGLNIDDGGTYETPAANIIIRNCVWENMAATGNNDELKLSGVDDFEITGCKFLNGSKGGSLIDMVGCHRGIISWNYFEEGGINSIQAKGGSENIIISRNHFHNGGQRVINLGGSTGVQYFRPQSADFEAGRISVWSNTFIGGTAPLAFAGAVNCEAAGNIIISPLKWVIRILQDNTDPRMQTCGKNIVQRNTIFFRGDSKSAINIGPNTDPGSFRFIGNMLFLPSDSLMASPDVLGIN
ncbi:MAG: right-handed parallel beta-helix repeat-containing protein [Bacteroidales bacterium]|nr:right-handed parallel beta-helix repeat-containing protein [Bacteroidales bacterium]